MSTTTRFSAEVKGELLALVRETVERTGWTIRRILKHLGLSKARYRDWRRREALDALTDQSPVPRTTDGILPVERAAVMAYAKTHPKDGYRRLAWQMLDADVAYVSPSSVYRILDAADLLYRWKRSASTGTAPPQPTRPHERWHTDLMYLRVADSWYFLVSVIDAYSRYLVHWELLRTMRASDVDLVIQAALERTGATPDVVTDSGSQFTSLEFKSLMRRFALKHIRIRTYHPESNGVIERYHRSTREALSEHALKDLGQVRGVIAEWVAHYNDERLHASLGYLPPAEYYRGDPAARQRERQEKLARAQTERRRMNRERLQEAA